MSDARQMLTFRRKKKTWRDGPSPTDPMAQINNFGSSRTCAVFWFFFPLQTAALLTSSGGGQVVEGAASGIC